MSKVKIIGEVMRNMPWQDKPVLCEGVVWRHDANPIIGWEPNAKDCTCF